MQVWKKLIIADNLKDWRSEQKNFSAEAEAVFEKIQNGEELTELDVFIICNDNQKQIDEYKKFYNIRKNIKDGKLSKNDLYFLIDTLCGDDWESADKLKAGFSSFITEEQEKNV